ncbi:hypothetical protein [Actinomyces weissii]|uniref:Uncharacterized protein n=1 Tax=Actinomyces weissii TaxID=675090 RepID=A0A7T7MA38_9ACTO|nr:hypothetical protein [Actinomyces weissii]QQM67719.1 hypothetical protein JG540_02225 [Actinomyces weissii]
MLKQTREAFDKTEQELTPRGEDSQPQRPTPQPQAEPPAQTPSGGTGGSGGSGGGGADLGGGAGVPSVTGGGGGANLGSTETEPHKDVNQVTGGSAQADLGQDLPPGAPEVGQVQGGGNRGEGVDGVVMGPHQDASRVDDTPANAELIKQLQEQGLPVFAVDGKVQRPLGQVEGIGTLLGSQDDPPTVSAVVDGNGKVVDIADLKPEYDEKGNLTGLNQVPVKVQDLGAATGQTEAGGAKAPGLVDGSAAPAPTLDTRTQEAVDRVKELFGGMVEVALTGGKGGGEPTLTLAGVSGIGLAALATLAALRRSGDDADTEVSDLGTGKEGLRSGLGDLSGGLKGDSAPRQATDRQNLIDALLKDLSPELSGDDAGAGGSGAQLRDSLAEAAEGLPTSGDGGDARLPEGAPGLSGEALKASLSDLGAGGGQDLGGDLPAGSDAGLTGSGAAGGAGGGASAAGGDLGGPLPSGSTSGGDLGGPLPSGSTSGGDLGGPLPSGSASGGAEAAPAAGAAASLDQGAETAHREEVVKERRHAHMMGGMGMAAGMSAAGGRAGLTGAEEEKRNEEARRLRDRLSSSKENS